MTISHKVIYPAGDRFLPVEFQLRSSAWKKLMHSPAFPADHPALVDHDPCNPGPEILRFAQPVSILPCFQGRFLHGVLAVRFTAQESTGDSIQHLFAFQKLQREVSFFHNGVYLFEGDFSVMTYIRCISKGKS